MPACGYEYYINTSEKSPIYYVSIMAVICSHMKIQSFQKAHLVFQWCLYNKGYYTDMSILLESTPLVKFIGHYIRDPSGLYPYPH